MELRNKIIGFIGIAALMLGVTAGIATAQSTDTGSGSVTISCGIPSTVEINDFTFEAVDLLDSNNTSTDPGAVQVKVDMGCYWGPWQVSATATHFTSPTTLQTFSAAHLSFQNPAVTSYSLSPIDPLGALEPDVSSAFFTGGGNGGTILETDENFLWFPFIGTVQLPDSPAPFVTTASYTGHLSNLPFIFSSLTGNSHTFTSTITVTLALV